ncbi:MAG TPA: mitochondrial fission ELM1 family protein [Methylomirabilota bacterium]|nr:mitochondrial fission ELM1 family protein [Methylomirabilota bacterium]
MWILTDGKAGDESPLLGIAAAMGVAPEVRRVSPGPPWVWAMPFGSIPPRDRPDRPKSPISPPFPDVCLATGRRAVAYVRALKRASPETLAVLYKDPRTRRHGADLLVVQAHDGRAGADTMVVTTGPHRLSRETLDAARAAPPPALSALSPPRLAVLVGGDSRHHRFTPADRERLLAGLEHCLADGASLMITASRRTPEPLRQGLAALGGREGAWMWDDAGANPLASMMALADTVVVTADSTNMIGEAAATGAPIQVFHPSGGHPKIDRFLKVLAAEATVAAFPAPLDLPRYPPIDSTPAIASAILDLWRARTAGRVSPSARPARS